MDLADAKWFKSSRSGANGSCVEVAFLAEAVAVRDTKDRDGGTLLFTRSEWAAFVGGAKQGEFDLPA
ncbi:DUF397 domain-containing protein [Actinoplanes sp. NPDC049316]|uniref:DUF397 domain-containing protein n=1 Tax=Actinoplanes sp. NPDC049316 TaxID=3154727 RepID=UPI00341D0FF7